MKKLKEKNLLDYWELPAIVFDENPIKTKNQYNNTNLGFMYLMQIK